jgi:endonuclease YncB( thermonuclease family)
MMSGNGLRRLLLLLCFAGHDVHAETISGRVITVVDGDTLTVLDAGNKRRSLRLAGVDAPERGQPFYVESARSLAAVCYRKPATVETAPKDASVPLVAKVECAGVDASSEQVRRGMAWTAKAYVPLGSALVELEAYARLRQLGLWADPDPVAPWEWRARQGAKAPAAAPR